jgi:uncharacterized protein YjiK
MNYLIFVSAMLISCASICTNGEKIIGYNLNKPSKILIMPDTLKEVSGLTIIDSTTFACIQDENGILFIYDIATNKIKDQIPFHIDGDYEGITKVDSSIFILRSDGTLFEIANYQAIDFNVTSYQTGIPANNNEGLCYDKANNRLLIACKGKIGKGSAFKDKRVIYGFDLSKKQLSREPIFDFDMQAVKEFAIKNKIDLPSKTRKKNGQQITEPFIKFRTSAICIHPKTKQLFLLSASDYLLFVFNSDGTLMQLEKLNYEIFNKAEGISFFENGDMLITNEGQNKCPTMLRFNYKTEQ